MLHLSGPARSVGAIVCGYSGIRTFEPQVLQHGGLFTNHSLCVAIAQSAVCCWWHFCGARTGCYGNQCGQPVCLNEGYGVYSREQCGSIEGDGTNRRLSGGKERMENVCVLYYYFVFYSVVGYVATFQEQASQQ